MRVTGRIVDMYAEPEMNRAMEQTGFRYALTIGGLDDRPFYVLRGVPDDIIAHVGKKVIVRGVERPDYELEEYAVLKCETIEESG